MDFGFLGVLALSALPVVLIGVILVFTITQYLREKALGKHLHLRGTVVLGQIVNHRVQETRRGCRYYLTYRYEVEEREHLYEQLVNVEGFNAVRDGESVELLVLPENPSLPRLAPIDRFQLHLL